MIHKLVFGVIFMGQYGHAEACLNKKVDDIQIRAFVKEIIIDIEQSRVHSLANKFRYPQDALGFEFKSKDDFVSQWKKDGRLKSAMELKMYDENDKYAETTRPKDSNTLKVFYRECKTVQFGITPGMIFDVEKIEGRYQIVFWTSVY